MIVCHVIEQSLNLCLNMTQYLWILYLSILYLPALLLNKKRVSFQPPEGEGGRVGRQRLQRSRAAESRGVHRDEDPQAPRHVAHQAQRRHRPPHRGQGHQPRQPVCQHRVSARLRQPV